MRRERQSGRLAAHALGATAAGVPTTILAGFFLSVAGLSLNLAWWIAVAVGLASGVALRARASLTRPEILCLGAAALAGALVPNDVYNKDIVWQVAFADEARYFNTLLLPGFFGATYSTKYDGWIFLLAGFSGMLRVEPLEVVHAANVLMFPALAYLACRAARILRLHPVHVPSLLACAVLFGGDAVRLISFGGPRTVATLLQIAGVLHLAHAVERPWPQGARPAIAAAVAFVASGVTHNFFGLANALLAASAICAAVVIVRARPGLLRTLVVFSGALALGYGPFLWIKWSAVPEGANSASPSESVAGPAFSWSTLVSARWGEYGTLWPYWILAVVLVSVGFDRARRPVESAKTLVFLAVTLLVLPLAVLLLPWTRFIISDVATGSRLIRLVPVSPVAMAWVAYGAYAHLFLLAGRQRPLAIAAAVLSLLAVTAPALDTVRWYERVWPAVKRGKSDDRFYYGVTVYLAPHVSAGCNVLADTKVTALRLAGILRGHRVYFLAQAPPVQFATWQDSFVHSGPMPAFDFMVRSASRAHEGTPEYRSGPLSVWRIAGHRDCSNPPDDNGG